ncbi:MAG: DNA-processing protein DprA [Bacillota bacterium]|nr:DNA-processing protein DprA [Bacillota bacterium]
MVSRKEKAARVELAALPGVGPKVYRCLVEAFGGAREALAAGPDRWRALRIFAAAASEGGRAEPKGRRRGAPAGRRTGEELLGVAEELGWTVLTWGEEGYPPLLLHTPEPPPVLYLRGSMVRDDWRAIAVVGTRRASAYGRYQAERLAGELAAEGLTVVSGLARGIDETAHRGALEAGGRTLAVLGCGPDRVYPPENAPLAEEIAESGAVLTEFPPGTPPLPGNFLWRNRVIAGLALGTVVVEAGERSGALNTAFHANDAGREVFAVPGEVGRPGSAGCHLLLRLGATLLEHGGQVKESLAHLLVPGLSFGPVWRRGPIAAADWRSTEAGEEGGEEGGALAGKLRHALREAPARVEELASRAGFPVSAVAAQLVLWELEGKVRGYADGRVALVPR